MAGFCEYGRADYSIDISSDAAHEHFMSMYDPCFDGTAAGAGFRSGDLIVGLEVCERAGDTCGGSEGRTTGPDGERCAAEVREEPGAGFTRRRVDITGSTTDEEWVRYAQSCEQLDPLRETVVWVRRKQRKRPRNRTAQTSLNT